MRISGYQDIRISGVCHHLNPVEKEALETPTEVFLVSQEDFVEVAHPSDKNPVVDVQLIETAG